MKNEKIVELLSKSIENLTNTLVLLTDKNNIITTIKENNSEQEEFIKNINDFNYDVTNITKSLSEKNTKIPDEEIIEKTMEKPKNTDTFIEVDFENKDPFKRLDDKVSNISEEVSTEKEENNIPNIVPKHKFPKVLYHSSGIELTPYEGVPIYKPDFILGSNQALFGVQGEWNVVVNYVDGKYITQHPQDHFNDVELKANK